MDSLPRSRTELTDWFHNNVHVFRSRELFKFLEAPIISGTAEVEVVKFCAQAGYVSSPSL